MILKLIVHSKNDIYLLGEEASFIPAKSINRKGKRKWKIKKNPSLFESMLISSNVLASPPFLKFSTCFFTRPRRFSYLDVSIEAARLRTDLPFFVKIERERKWGEFSLE